MESAYQNDERNRSNEAPNEVVINVEPAAVGKETGHIKQLSWIPTLRKDPEPPTLSQETTPPFAFENTLSMVEKNLINNSELAWTQRSLVTHLLQPRAGSL